MTLEELLSDLEKKADAATEKWVCRERGHGIMREFEITEDKCGGILFRSTSYGKMREDAEFIGALNPEQVKKLIAALVVAEGAMECNESFHRLGGIDDCEPCKARKSMREILECE